MDIDLSLPPISLEFYVDDQVQAKRPWGCMQVIRSPDHAMNRVVVVLTCRGIAMPSDASTKVTHLGEYSHRGGHVEAHEMEHTLNCIFPEPGRYGLHVDVTVAFANGLTWRARARLEPHITVHGPQKNRHATKVFNIKSGAATDAAVNWMPVRIFEADSKPEEQRGHQIPPVDWRPRQVIWEEGRYAEPEGWNRKVDFYPHSVPKSPEDVIVGTAPWADTTSIQKALLMVNPGGRIWLLSEVHEGSFIVTKQVNIQGLETVEATQIKPAEGEPILIQAPGVVFKDVTLPTRDSADMPMIKVEGKGSVSASDCLFTDDSKTVVDDPRKVQTEVYDSSKWTQFFAILTLIFFVCLMWVLIRPREGGVRTVEKTVYVDKPVTVEKTVYVDKPVEVEKTRYVDKPVIVEKHVREYHVTEIGDAVAWGADGGGDKKRRYPGESLRQPIRMGGIWGRSRADNQGQWTVDGITITNSVVKDHPGLRLEWTGTGPWPSSGLQLWLRNSSEKVNDMEETQQPSEATGWTRMPLP